MSIAKGENRKMDPLSQIACNIDPRACGVRALFLPSNLGMLETLQGAATQDHRYLEIAEAGEFSHRNFKYDHSDARMEELYEQSGGRGWKSEDSNKLLLGDQSEHQRSTSDQFVFQTNQAQQLPNQTKLATEFTIYSASKRMEQEKKLSDIRAAALMTASSSIPTSEIGGMTAMGRLSRFSSSYDAATAGMEQMFLRPYFFDFGTDIILGSSPILLKPGTGLGDGIDYIHSFCTTFYKSGKPSQAQDQADYSTDDDDDDEGGVSLLEFPDPYELRPSGEPSLSDIHEEQDYSTDDNEEGGVSLLEFPFPGDIIIRENKNTISYPDERNYSTDDDEEGGVSLLEFPFSDDVIVEENASRVSRHQEEEEYSTDDDEEGGVSLLEFPDPDNNPRMHSPGAIHVSHMRGKFTGQATGTSPPKQA
jgi:hypothetical protein